MELFTKEQIRKLIIEKREEVSVETRAQWDIDIFNKFVNSDFYSRAKVIFTFVSFKSEADTHRIIKQALSEDKIVCVPKIRSREKGIEVFKIKGMDDLSTGYFGILEPSENCESADIRDIDLILMPGVAFDKKGGRLGYGKGYYDSFLKKMDKEVEKIALAYNFQVVERVPMDERDVPIDGIITDKEIIMVK